MIISQTYKPIIFLFFCLSCYACHDKVALKTALIEKTVLEKVEERKRKKNKACLEAAMTEALVIADSLMIQIALSKVDTSGRILKPTKPVRPAIDLPVDTTPIKPLFKDSVIIPIDSTLLDPKPKVLKTDTIANER